MPKRDTIMDKKFSIPDKTVKKSKNHSMVLTIAIMIYSDYFKASD